MVLQVFTHTSNAQNLAIINKNGLIYYVNLIRVLEVFWKTIDGNETQSLTLKHVFTEIKTIFEYRM